MVAGTYDAQDRLLTCGGISDASTVDGEWATVTTSRASRLDLEGMITRRRPLDEIGAAFDDLRAARGLRTVLAC